mgnify:CR=1 FL=1
MTEWVLLANQLIQVSKAISKRVKKTPPELRKAAIIEFDRALQKAQDPNEASTKELEEWFTRHL